jgi:hypothetical protein
LFSASLQTISIAKDFIEMMHPRNVYNKPADFAELAKIYPEFARISQLVCKKKNSTTVVNN